MVSERLGGLVVERSMVWARGGSRVEGAGQPSSLISMASALLGEAADRSWLKGGRASVSGGAIGLALLSLWNASWSSPRLGEWGGEV